MAEPLSIQSVLRSLIRTPDEKFQTYNRYGKTLPGVEWLPLSGGAEADKEVYLIRFGPGSRSHPHIHQGSEEFLVLDGELTDHDGWSSKPVTLSVSSRAQSIGHFRKMVARSLLFSPVVPIGHCQRLHQMRSCNAAG